MSKQLETRKIEVDQEVRVWRCDSAGCTTQVADEHMDCPPHLPVGWVSVAQSVDSGLPNIREFCPDCADFILKFIAL